MAGTNSIPSELGTEKISKLLKQYALPSIIAMTAASLYNMVDSIFIGQGVGPLAISGLAVTFPLMNLQTAFGTLVGVGASTMISVLLGQKNYDNANKVLGNMITLNLVASIIFTIITLIFIDPILYFFGASENTLPYAKEYMEIILYGNVITHIYFALNGAMRSSGSPKKAMKMTIFTVLFNAALDPLFIFTFDMGIKGAAWATIIAQTIAMTAELIHFTDKKSYLRIHKEGMKLDKRITIDSLTIGVGPFLMHSAACVVTLFINQQLRTYSGDLGIGAYGIANRLTFMFVMICLGLNQGMQPIAGYNYGARLYSRVREVFKQTALIATGVTTVCFLVSFFIPEAAVSIFTSDHELRALAAYGLRTMNIAFIIVGWQMIATNLFQSIGMIDKSIFLSVCRQILFLLPLLYILPRYFDARGIWYSFPISDLMALIPTTILMIRLYSKFGRLKDGDSPAILGSKI